MHLSYSLFAHRISCSQVPKSCGGLRGVYVHIIGSACACAWMCVKVSSPAQFLFLFLYPLAQVLISQPRDQRRSLAISQREPLIPHRSTRDTAAPWTPREAPQSFSRASGEREKEKRKRERERERAKEGGAACVCVYFSTGSGRSKLELFLCRGTWNNEARAGFNKARFPSFQLWREADEPAAESDR